MCRLCDLVGAGRPRLFDAPDAEEESVPVLGVTDSSQVSEPVQAASGAAEQEESVQAAVRVQPTLSGSGRL
ncbi:MAG: hypothetical protein GX049_08020 [Alcaligenaceae bacterium]|nr:hypothetical protein [Alcaligenaceae bacterium]